MSLMQEEVEEELGSNSHERMSAQVIVLHTEVWGRTVCKDQNGTTLESCGLALIHAHQFYVALSSAPC